MAEGRTRRPRAAGLTGILLAVVGFGCAPAAPIPAVAPVAVPLGDAEALGVARLLRLEDRREYDESALGEAAAAAHPELRRRAALAIGRIRDPAGLPLLVHLLADRDTAVAATAAFAIGQLGDTTAVAELSALLRGEQSADRGHVLAEAAAALGKLMVPAASAALVEYLERAPEPRGRDPVVENALLAVWRHPRGPDPAPIFRWTAHYEPEIRWRAVYALVRRPDPAATRHLLQLTDDADPRVRELALRGLTGPLADSAGLAPEAVLPVLLRAVTGTDYGSVVNAARSLGTFRRAEAVAALVPLLERESWRAIVAAESLGRLAQVAAPAAAPLESLALDGARAVPERSAALAALVQVDPPQAAAVAERLAQEPAWRLRAAAGRALASLDPRLRPELERLLRDGDARVAAATLQALVDNAGEEIGTLRPVLLESLAAPDVQLRTAALAGLARLRDPATLPLLVDAFARAQRDTLNDAALAALDALGALREAGVPAANALIVRVSRPGDYLVHQRGVSALGPSISAAWGEPLPIETGLSLADYEDLVRRFVVPAGEGRPLPRARIVTESGEIELELAAADAPLTVQSFLRLAERGYFDGQEWPRVVPNFVIQGGDPRGDQTGGPGYAIRDELNRQRYLRGTLGMALSGPDTGGSQFFVTHSPQPHLDGGYTVFGRVVEGMEIVDRVVAGERIDNIRPLE